MAGFSDEIRRALEQVNIGARVRRLQDEQRRARLGAFRRLTDQSQLAGVRDAFKLARSFGELARQSWALAMPGNWEGLSMDDQEAAIDLVQETEWCLIWVPRREIVVALLSADAVEREGVLLRRADDVLEDLRACLDDAPTADPELKTQALAAIDAWSAGHWRPAQALAAASLTTAIEQGMGFERMGQAAKKLPRDPETVGMTLLRLALVTSAIDFDSYFGDSPPPSGFSRNRSVHHAHDPAQYTEINSLASLMLLVGLLREAEHWYDEEIVDE